jgi:hypothetical protein
MVLVRPGRAGGSVTSAGTPQAPMSNAALRRRTRLIAAPRRLPAAPLRGIDTDESEAAAEGPRFWTRETLQKVVERVLGRRHFIVVSNREPYIHRLDGEEIVCERPRDAVMRVGASRICPAAHLAAHVSS